MRWSERGEANRDRLRRGRVRAQAGCGVRAAQVQDVYSAERARKSNNARIMALGGKKMGVEHDRSCVRAWLASGFAGGGSARKVERIMAGELRKQDEA
jgi:ribose 5-phosphate isomerase B